MTCVLRRCVLIAAIGLAGPLGVLFLAEAASATLRQMLTEAAEDLAKQLNTQNKPAVAIGQFSGPASFPNSGGAALAQTLTEELKNKKIEVKPKGDLGVKGTYRIVEVPGEDPADKGLKGKVLGLEMEITAEDARGKKLDNFSFKKILRGEDLLLQLLGFTAALNPGGTERERDQELRKQFLEPKPDVRGTVLRAKAGRPYAIEILVEGTPRTADNKDGLLFVGIQRDESYAVRLLNETDYEAAVQLRIDGLSMFAFSEQRQPEQIDGKDNPLKGEPLYTVVLVPPKKDGKPGTTLIKGWHINNQQTDKFLVTEYAKSGAASLQHTADIGTITAIFQAAWEEGKRPPADEPGKRRGGTGDATGRGDRIGEEYRELYRQFGVIRDAISVRYTRPSAKE